MISEGNYFNHFNPINFGWFSKDEKILKIKLLQNTLSYFNSNVNDSLWDLHHPLQSVVTFLVKNNFKLRFENKAEGIISKRGKYTVRGQIKVAHHFLVRIFISA